LTPDLVGSDKNDGDPRVSLGTPIAHLAIAWHVRHNFGTGVRCTDRSWKVPVQA